MSPTTLRMITDHGNEIFDRMDFLKRFDEQRPCFNRAFACIEAKHMKDPGSLGIKPYVFLELR